MNFSKHSKIISTTIAIALAFLMVSSVLYVAQTAMTNTVKAQTTYSTGFNPSGVPYSTDLSQYEWPQSQADSSCSRFSAGPGPNAADFLWQDNNLSALINALPSINNNNNTVPGWPITTPTLTIGGVVTPEPGLASLTMVETAYPTAFNGMVFIICAPNGNWENNFTCVVAMNAQTGIVVWATRIPNNIGSIFWFPRVPNSVGICKISPTLMVVGPYCLNIATGAIVWEASPVPLSTANYQYNATLQGTGTTTFEYETAWGGGCTFDPTTMTVYTGAQAWNLTNTAAPPTLIWNIGGEYASTGEPVVGDGIVTEGSSQAYYVGFNATTGAFLWSTPTHGEMGYQGSYYDGMILRGGTTDDDMYCFNITTGQIIWIYNPNSYEGFWASAPAIAYGNVYELNENNYLYCINIATGHEVWAYPCEGVYYTGYPVIADGKVYAETGADNAIPRVTNSTFGTNETQDTISCIDAFTGCVIWKIPYAQGDPQTTACLAYGNFYFMPTATGYGQTVTVAGQGSTIVSGATNQALFNEFWCIGGPQAWTNFRGTPQQSGTVAGQAGPATLNLLWSYTTDGAIISSPAVGNGLVYFTSQDGNLYCLNSWDGALVWNYSVGNQIRCRSSPALYNGMVFFSDNGYAYGLNAYTGALIWRTADGAATLHFDVTGNVIYSTTEDPIMSSPIIFGGNLYVGSLDGNLYCMNAASGAIVWAYQTGAPICSSPSVDPATSSIFIRSTTSNYILRLAAGTGALLQQYYVTGSNPTSVTLTSGIVSTPTVANGMIFVSAANTFWYALNETNGNLIWSHRYITSFATVILSSMLYANPSGAPQGGEVFSIDQFHPFALNATTGALIWIDYVGRECYASMTYTSAAPPGIGSGPEEPAGIVYVSSESRQFYSIDAQSGDIVGFYSNNVLANGWSSPALYEGIEFIGDANGVFYALSDLGPEYTGTTLSLDNAYPSVNTPVTISGSLGLPVPNMTVTVSVGANGVRTDINATTDGNGNFAVSYTPTAAGTYSVLARFLGYEYYAPSTSEIHTITASAASAVTTPTPTTGTTPTPAVPEFGAAAALITVAAMVVAAVCAVALTVRKRKH